MGRRVHTTADTPKLQRNGQSSAELRHPQSPVKFDSKSHRVTDTSLSPGVRRHGPFYQDADYMAGTMSAGRTRSGVGDATDAPTPGRGEFSPRASAPTGTHVSSINPSHGCDDDSAPAADLEVIAGKGTAGGARLHARDLDGQERGTARGARLRARALDRRGGGEPSSRGRAANKTSVCGAERRSE